MLVTRPILLYLAKLKYETGGDREAPTVTPVLLKISSMCVEAADRTLRVLFALQQQQLLGMC